MVTLFWESLHLIYALHNVPGVELPPEMPTAVPTYRGPIHTYCYTDMRAWCMVRLILFSSFEMCMRNRGGKLNGSRDLHFFLPESGKKLECILFPNLSHRLPVRCAVRIIQLRYTSTCARSNKKEENHHVSTKKLTHHFAKLRSSLLYGLF